MAIQHTLYISATRLKTDSALQGSVDDDLIMPYILLAQDMHILPALGTELDNDLKAHIQAGSLAGESSNVIVGLDVNPEPSLFRNISLT